MTKITDNILKGNLSTSLVSFKLSKHCLVRPVLEGTDIGIDLYCESFDKKGLPFQHFWVQVKSGTKKIKVSNDESFASYSFKSDHLFYWSKQPIPVFTFLVPNIDSYNEKNFTFYIVDITNQVLRSEISNTNKSRTLKSNLKISDDDSLQNFIFNHVPYSSAVQKVSYGVLTSILSVKPNYMKSIPMGLSRIHLDKILRSIRQTSTFAFVELIDSYYDNSNLKKKILKLKEVVEIFKDDLKYEIPYSLGVFEYINKNFHKAIEYFKRSIEIIDLDPHLKDTPALQQWKSIIQGMIKEAKKMISL